MKKSFVIIVLGSLFSVNTAFGQDLKPNQIPSVIVNSFRQEFPKATEVEWEMDGELYRVEFEATGANEHEIWYNQSGEMAMHEEEIPETELPEQVLSAIRSEFSAFKVDEAKRIVEGNATTTYEVELESSSEEWKITFSSGGEVLSKVAD